MRVTVSHQKPGVFFLEVRGAQHRPDYVECFETMDTVWTAARKIGEAEQDYRIKHGKGWVK